MGCVGRVREVEQMEKKSEKKDEWESDFPSFQTCCHNPEKNLLRTLFPHNRIIPKTFGVREMLFSFKSSFKVHKIRILFSRLNSPYIFIICP